MWGIPRGIQRRTSIAAIGGCRARPFCIRWATMPLVCQPKSMRFGRTHHRGKALRRTSPISLFGWLIRTRRWSIGVLDWERSLPMKRSSMVDPSVETIRFRGFRSSSGCSESPRMRIGCWPTWTLWTGLQGSRSCKPIG